jgi:hypothetical protein
VISNTQGRFSDAVELLNISSAPVNLSEWILTDQTDDPSHYSALPFITLQPGEYITFDVCRPGNTCEGGFLSFGISSANGDELYLMSRDEIGNLRNFIDYVEIPPTFGGEKSGDNGGVSLGRWPNGTGELFPMQSRTIGQYNTTPKPGFVHTSGANSGPLVSDVVISEFMYNPGGANSHDFEFIELFNRNSQASVTLGPKEEPDAGEGWPSPPEGWRIRGAVDFDFDASHVVPPRGTIVVVGFDPDANATKAAAFRTRYGIDAGVKLVGPFQKWQTMPDGGGEIRLEANEYSPLTITDPAEKHTPNILVDRVIYDDAHPWPSMAAGHGQSLSRASDVQFGGFAESWVAATPSPGSYSPTGPRVKSVVVWGSAWSETIRNAFLAAGSPAKGYEIRSGTAQLAPLPWTNLDRVSLVFDRDVTIDAGALSAVPLQPGNYTASSLPSYDPATFTATWSLLSVISAGQVLLSLSDSKVRTANLALDGEWANGWPAEFSGNGTPGGAFLFSFNVLPGDSNQDGRVDGGDLQRVIAAAFSTPASAQFAATSDLDGSGIVNVVDAIQSRNLGNPPATAAFGAPAAVIRRSEGTENLRANRGRRAGRETSTDSKLTGSAVDEVLRAAVDRRTTASATSPRAARALRR